jgi:hypothetical protein
VAHTSSSSSYIYTYLIKNNAKVPILRESRNSLSQIHYFWVLIVWRFKSFALSLPKTGNI